MVIFPLAPDQTIAQMWSNGARGVTNPSNKTTQCRVIKVTRIITQAHISLLK